MITILIKERLAAKGNIQYMGKNMVTPFTLGANQKTTGGIICFRILKDKSTAPTDYTS